MTDADETLTIDLDMLDFTFGGAAFGRMADGKPVFVPFAIPGERVRVRIPRERKDYNIGELVEVLTPSPQRITPRCRHFGECGGCHYQHLTYAHQLEVKEKIVLDQMRRIGKMAEPPVRPIIPSPAGWNYRNTMQFHLSTDGKPGFRDVSGVRVMEIHECHLPQPEIDETWPNLDIDPAAGIDRVMLRAGSDGELLAGLEGNQEKPPELELDAPLSLHYLGRGGDYLMAGDAYSIMRVNGMDFAVSPRSFFQVNLPQAEAMVQYVLANCNINAESTALDLYCGVGLFSAFLAPKVKQLAGVELSESACNDFALNLDAHDNVSLYVGKVEEVVTSLELKPDLVILDPPRAGLDRRVVEYLKKVKPQQVIYVSCDPSTLARDCKRLIEGGFTVESIQPFDLFPHTYHVECVVMLSEKFDSES
jgi:23S rRNA (uracil1939-C5)-methyltransferase